MNTEFAPWSLCGISILSNTIMFQACVYTLTCLGIKNIGPDKRTVCLRTDPGLFCQILALKRAKYRCVTITQSHMWKAKTQSHTGNITIRFVEAHDDVCFKLSIVGSYRLQKIQEICLFTNWIHTHLIHVTKTKMWAWIGPIIKHSYTGHVQIFGSCSVKGSVKGSICLKLCLLEECYLLWLVRRHDYKLRTSTTAGAE